MDSAIKLEKDPSQVLENENISDENDIQTVEGTSASKSGKRGMKEIKKDEQTAEIPQKCILCGKMVKTSAERVVHMRTHSELKPFTCNICGKGFINSSNLTVHMRTHSEETLHLKYLWQRIY